MPAQIGFDNQGYLEQQSAAILDRVKESGGKLDLELVGKLVFDCPTASSLILHATSEPAFASKYLFAS
jgi:uncharacterized protein (UPF0371 family)